eukprot:5612913-Lingulodinium_polyedra.AAC.1
MSAGSSSFTPGSRATLGTSCGAEQARSAPSSAAPRRGAMLLIIGGSPCQQLSMAGTHRGEIGLEGADS